MKNNGMYNTLKEATYEIKKLKVDLGSINPKDQTKKKLKSNVNVVKAKMLQAIHNLENKIENQIKAKVADTIQNETTIQNPIKKESNRTVFVNTFDRLTKKRANDLLQLRHNSQLDKTRSSSHQSYLWGKPTKVESKRLEDNIPDHLRVDKFAHPQTKEFLIKTLVKNDCGGGVYAGSAGNTAQNFFVKPNFEFKKQGASFHERSKSGFYGQKPDSPSISKFYEKNKSKEHSFYARKPNFRVNNDSTLDHGRDTSAIKGKKGKICLGKTAKPKKILPKEVRENPFCNLPVLMDDDQNLGLINLVNQGLIPKDVDVSPALDRDDPVLKTRKINNYNVKNFEANMHVNALLDQALQLSNNRNQILTYRSRMNSDFSEDDQPKIAKMSENTSFYSKHNKSRITKKSEKGIVPAKSAYGLKNYENMVDGYKKEQTIIPEDLTAYNTKQVIDNINKTNLKVFDGKIQENEPDFLQFKTKNFYMWGDIKITLISLEKLLQKHSILTTKLDKDNILKIAKRMNMPTEKQLFECLENKDMVLELIPNRAEILSERIEKYLILKIQAFWKAHLARKYYKKVKQFKRTFIFIQNEMRICHNYKVLKRKIFKIYKMYQIQFNYNQSALKDRWPDIKNSSRLEIHINSLGYDKFKRKTTNNYLHRQNLQLSRIFRLRDPNLELVIITSCEIQIELLAYYVKILQVSGIKDPASRIHFQYPENAHKFDANELCLSANIYYSPEQMKKITFITEGKNAYIVNGYPSNYDLILSAKLNVPILTGDPNVNRNYSTQHTSKLLFDDINLPTMPHSEVLVDEKDMIKSFAKLILDNTNFDKWVFKINDEFQGRGIADYSTDGLELVSKVKNDPTLAKSEEIQNELEACLKRFLPSHLTPASQGLFRNYLDYEETFLNMGGIIEGCPKSNFKSVGLVFYIDPEGIFDIITHYEKIVMNKMTIGYVLPQKLVPLKVLVQTAKKVAVYLYDNNIYGYITIDFMVLQSGSSTIKISPNGLKCYYDDFIAIYEQFSLFSNLNNSKNDDEISAIIFPTIDNLGFSSKLNYEQFFDNCRKQSLFYDINNNSGTMFVPYDELGKGVMGLMVIDSDQKQILKYANKALTYINNLMTQDEVECDEDQKKHLVTASMVSDKLYSYQKQFS